MKTTWDVRLHDPAENDVRDTRARTLALLLLPCVRLCVRLKWSLQTSAERVMSCMSARTHMRSHTHIHSHAGWMGF